MMNERKKIELHLLRKYREFRANKRKFGDVAALTLTAAYATAGLMDLYKDLYGARELKNFVRLNFEEDDAGRAIEWASRHV